MMAKRRKAFSEKAGQEKQNVIRGGINMIGRQVLLIKKSLTLQELEQIMQENWDREQYGSFTVGKPTKASVRRRLEGKRRRSDVKRGRRPPSLDD